jgi:peptide deformylase
LTFSAPDLQSEWATLWRIDLDKHGSLRQGGFENKSHPGAETMFESDSTPCPTKAKQQRWDRPTSTTNVAAFQAELHQSFSQRQYAREHNIPRSTLQYWLSRKATIDADPTVVDFFESSVGLAFLHRLVVAAHLVFNQEGPCGIRLICEYLELTGLHRFAAASIGSQHKMARRMEEQIIAYSVQEQTRLANTMAPKIITVCEDETYHPEICLVAIEPVSNFILAEKYVKHRDAETWDQAIKQATEGLPVDIIQSTSDEAKGILFHAQQSLGANHSPDLFHAQRELHKATSLPLRTRVAAGTEAVEKAEKQRREFETDYAAALEKRRPKAAPPNDPKWIEAARQIEQDARLELVAAEKRRDQMRAAIKGLGEVYHPYDPRSGQAMSAAEVEQRLNEQFAQIDQAAGAAQLSESSQKRIEKARRLLKGFVAVIAFFHLHVQLWIKELTLSPEIEQFVLEQLIPALYLERTAKKLSTSEERAKVRAVCEPMLARARAPGNPLEALQDSERIKIMQVANQCADLFQRSSSCVEGRNGQLALRHHSLHQLSDKKLTALTVIHNFHLTRTDGTTAAERFFGNKPIALFSWLLDHLEVPTRPAARRSKTARKAV